MITRTCSSLGYFELSGTGSGGGREVCGRGRGTGYGNEQIEERIDGRAAAVGYLGDGNLDICELIRILRSDKTHMAEKWLTTTLRALITLANSPTSSGVECPLL